MATVKLSKSGHVFWLFGLSGAGKSTLAEQLALDLRASGEAVLMLDGDHLRSGLCRGLGFSDEDRAENLRRAAEVARVGLRSSLCVVASFITPRADHRNLVAKIIGAENLSFIHVSAPLDVCRARDVKGLYQASTRGAVQLMTGLDSSFEWPKDVDLELPTATQTPEESAERLRLFAFSQLS